MTKRKSVCLVVLYCLFLFSCGKGLVEKRIYREYGRNMDSLRILHNLPIMDSQFYISNYGLDFAFFENREGDKYPAYVSKSVFWDSIGVYLERNYFYRSNSERLQIYCFFRKVEGIDTAGTCYWYENGKNNVSLFLTKVQSDSLLHEWNIDNVFE